MKPVYLEHNHYGVLAVSGLSGSGKSSAVRFYVSQLALSGALLYLCDPHGNTQRDNLKQSLEPLLDILVEPVAVDKADILDRLRSIERLYIARKNAHDVSHVPTFLILDETTAFCLSLTKSEMQYFAEILLHIANEGRKLGIHVILISQNWKADFIGSKSVRNSIGAVLFMRTAEEEVKLFFPSLPADKRRTISNLKTGEAILIAPSHVFVKLHIPYISLDDIEQIRMVVRSIYLQNNVHAHIHADTRSSTRYAKIDTRNDTRRYSIHDGDHAQYDAVNQETCTDDNDVKNEDFTQLERKLHELARIILSGEMNKEQTIYHVFGIRKAGKSKRWLTCSSVYDKVKHYVTKNP